MVEALSTQLFFQMLPFLRSNVIQGSVAVCKALQRWILHSASCLWGAKMVVEVNRWLQ